MHSSSPSINLFLTTIPIFCFWYQKVNRPYYSTGFIAYLNQRSWFKYCFYLHYKRDDIVFMNQTFVDDLSHRIFRYAYQSFTNASQPWRKGNDELPLILHPLQLFKHACLGSQSWVPNWNLCPLLTTGHITWGCVHYHQHYPSLPVDNTLGCLWPHYEVNLVRLGIWHAWGSASFSQTKCVHHSKSVLSQS